MDEMYTLIRFTGPRFFSLMLPGYTAYVLDFLYAANTIISNSDLKGMIKIGSKGPSIKEVSFEWEEEGQKLQKLKIEATSNMGSP